ncbi:MAG: hypothetical protein A6F71_03295 [Cycloclasticus sp. symbiont of Poecilosclerida sp. M]|nr:MAG: hypothetical protein A6F71_03295 [Cycloclasticus sp. symbiont of Poecilosclerida sp. M]
MKLLKTTAAAALLAAAGAASADSIVGSFGDSSLRLTATANVTLTTDYVFRGVSFSNNKPAIQGGFDLDLGNGVYLGTWGSSINLDASDDDGGDAGLELDIYGGWTGTYNSFGVDIGFIHYHFSGAEKLNTNEVYVGISQGPFTVTQYMGVAGNSDTTGGRDFGNYTHGSVDLGSLARWIPSAGPIGVVANLGWTNGYEGIDDYYDWKLAFTRSLLGLDVELAYTGTDQKEQGFKNDDDKLVLSVSKSL